MDLEVIFAGIGAILTAAGGCYLVIHEFRLRERRACKKEIDELSADLHTTRQENITLRRWIHQVRILGSAAGIELPDDPPELER